MKYLDKLLSSKKTIFTYSDIKTILSKDNIDTIKSFFARWVSEGIFINLYKGIYWFKNYNVCELGVKLKKNSYISFETILKKEGVIFQDYGNSIFLASDNTITKITNNTTFHYLKLKSSILTNPLWIINTWGYMVATPERAICDRLYLSPNYYFDNLQWINYMLLENIAQMYNKRVILAVKKMIYHAQSR